MTASHFSTCASVCRSALPVGDEPDLDGAVADSFMACGTSIDCAVFADEIDGCENRIVVPAGMVNDALPRSAQPQIKRALPAMCAMGVFEAEHQRAEFRQCQPLRNRPFEY